MLFFTESDVREGLPMADTVRLMRTVFTRLRSGEAINHPRRRLILPTGSVLHYMAAGDGKYFGAKLYSTNAKHGAHFLFLLYRAEDARPLAVFEANYLGQIRTGAASGYATDLLARAGADTLGVIGSGFQARTQVEAVLAVRQIRRVRVWSRSEDKRRAFAAKISEDLGVESAAVGTVEEAVAGAGIVVTSTNAREPVLDAAWVEPGTHINATGSNQAGKRELPADLIRRAALIAVDSIEQARMESGDLLLAVPAEQWSTLPLTELKEAPARPSEEAITIFKSNGLAAEDVIAAAYVYEAAVARGETHSIPILE